MYIIKIKGLVCSCRVLIGSNVQLVLSTIDITGLEKQRKGCVLFKALIFYFDPVFVVLLVVELAPPGP